MSNTAHFSPYTEDPGEGPFVIFPTHAHQILSNCIHILGASILAYCFARRTEKVFEFGWAGITWTKLCVILVFLDSWVFLALSGVIINGVGLTYSVSVCSLGIISCIVFYAASKALIYLFLVERVWVVWSAGNSVSRLQSRVYCICAGIVALFGVIFFLMIFGKIARIRQDGACVIGLRTFASIPLLSYDLFVNVVLTSMFVWPLYREQRIGRRLRNLAWRTLAAALVALTTSSVNIAILAISGGHQLGWVCLGSCSTDVTINALVLYWVTAGAHRASSNHKNTLTLPTLHVPLTLVRDQYTLRDGDEYEYDENEVNKEKDGPNRNTQLTHGDQCKCQCDRFDKFTGYECECTCETINMAVANAQQQQRGEHPIEIHTDSPTEMENAFIHTHSRSRSFPPGSIMSNAHLARGTEFTPRVVHSNLALPTVLQTQRPAMLRISTSDAIVRQNFSGFDHRQCEGGARLNNGGAALLGSPMSPPLSSATMVEATDTTTQLSFSFARPSSSRPQLQEPQRQEREREVDVIENRNNALTRYSSREEHASSPVAEGSRRRNDDERSHDRPWGWRAIKSWTLHGWELRGRNETVSASYDSKVERGERNEAVRHLSRSGIQNEKDFSQNNTRTSVIARHSFERTS